MKLYEIREDILKTLYDMTFVYKGIRGGIFSYIENGQFEGYITYNEEDTPDFYSIDELMEYKFIDGKSLIEIGEELEFNYNTIK